MNAKKILFLIVCLCASMLVQAQIKLSFNPSAGKTYSYRFISEQTVKQTMSGQEIPVNIVMEMLMEMTVKEKNNDEISMDYSYKEMVMSISSPMMDIKFDSRNTADSLSVQGVPLSQVFNSLIGKTMNVIFSPDGSVKSVSGFNAIMEDIQKNVASADPLAQQKLNIFLQSFNEGTTKNMFEQSFKMYPDKEVAVGDSWNSNVSLPVVAGMTNNIQNTYTLKSVENGIAMLDVASVANMSANNAADVEGELSGGYKGTMTLNVQTGMLINSTLEGNINGKMTTQGMEILMDMASKMTINLQQ